MIPRVEVPTQHDVTRGVGQTLHRDMINLPRLRIESDPAGVKTVSRVVAIVDVIVRRHRRQLAEAVAGIDCQQRVETAAGRVDRRHARGRRRLPAQPDRMCPPLVRVVRLSRLARGADVAAATNSSQPAHHIGAAQVVREGQIREQKRSDPSHVAVHGAQRVRHRNAVIAGVGGQEACDDEYRTVCPRNVHAVQSPLIEQRPAPGRLDAQAQSGPRQNIGAEGLLGDGYLRRGPEWNQRQQE